jgi:hypothetical protein
MRDQPQFMQQRPTIVPLRYVENGLGGYHWLREDCNNALRNNTIS